MHRFDALPQPFVRAEAIEAGLCPRALRRAVTSGRVTRLASGLYAVTSAWEPLSPWAQFTMRSRTAVRATPDAIVSHSAAAALLGLPHPAHRQVKVPMTLLDDGRTSPKDAWRHFHRGATPPEHIVIRAGRPYFTPDRTVIDCCRELHPRDALAVMDGALRAGLVTTDRLTSMRRHQRRWPGVTDADVVLRLTDGRRENWLESVSAWAIHAAGHPAAVPQVMVVDRAGRAIGRVDALWPELGVVGEADGLGKYALDATGRQADDEVAATTLSVHAERVRGNRLHDVGLEVFRWDAAEALAMTPLGERFAAACERADPRKVTATFRCVCCRRPLASCAKGTFSAA